MHHTPRAPYRLAASLLALTAALAGCGGGGSSDSGGSTPTPTPTQQINVAFTSPSAANNVHDINTPVYLEVRVDVNDNPAANNTPVIFNGAAASFAPVQAMTIGGKATTTFQGNQVGPLQVQATTTVSNQSKSESRTLYIRPKREPLEVLVPAYFSPGKNSPWDTLISGAKSYPDVRITAILNPNDGIFTKEDTKFTEAITAFKAQGGKVIGYVSTAFGNGKRSVADVKANIDAYRTYYPTIDGIFLDEMASSANRLDFYRDIYSYIKGLDATLHVVGNPGTFPSAAYAGVANALVTFEDKEEDYRGIDPQQLGNTWVYDRANSAQVMLAHNAGTCTAMQNAVKTANLARTNAGVVYVTDLEYDSATNTGNPWATLPTYWTQLLGTVDAINKSRALPSC
ncbi:Spherulation-specific family 4 [Paenacidovorax caeni]|uniref:Spherulation-specific family 4 n=1 Tax=Paenacidovorax caeni TaxID=343013 RepID=A0A1I7FTN2_9BURK|nr:spherulation-specific family 4 protein [Paenacidovorax caeni]SFU39366.1 Spherulation-specific family 4 [Paenacidovorax caeni]